MAARRTYELVPGVHWAQVEDLVYLLDERRGQYFGLGPEDARLWPALLARDPPPAESPLLHHAHALGWLRPAGTASSPPAELPAAAAGRPRNLSWIRASACLMRSYASFRLLGFARTYHWARVAERHVARPRGKAAAAVAAGCATFKGAEAVIPSRRGMEDCLPRSVALFVFLRRAGLPVRHHIGVKAFPFAAHAWVEYGAEPLLDEPRRVQSFVRIASLG